MPIHPSGHALEANVCLVGPRAWRFTAGSPKNHQQSLEENHLNQTSMTWAFHANFPGRTKTLPKYNTRFSLWGTHSYISIHILLVRKLRHVLLSHLWKVAKLNFSSRRRKMSVPGLGCWLSKAKRYPFLLVELVFHAVGARCSPIQTEQSRFETYRNISQNPWVPVRSIYHLCSRKKSSMDHPGTNRPLCVRRTHRTFGGFDGFNGFGMLAKNVRCNELLTEKQRLPVDFSISTWFLRTSSRLYF